MLEGIDGPIDYLELGVYEGESIKYWAQANTNPGSRFWGFDSFEGLPEAWSGAFNSMAEGTFDTGGNVPVVDDERVHFVKGWFQETIPPFLDGFEQRNQLVVHYDADLYTSTLYGLCKLDVISKPGTILIFDEFGGADGEAKAFDDYSRSFLRDFEVVGQTTGGWRVALRLK
ncbi:TylF/MycF/NovP-related O-methyltransferase [Nocardioides dilutus]